MPLTLEQQVMLPRATERVYWEVHLQLLAEFMRLIGRGSEAPDLSVLLSQTTTLTHLSRRILNDADRKAARTILDALRVAYVSGRVDALVELRVPMEVTSLATRLQPLVDSVAAGVTGQRYAVLRQVNDAFRDVAVTANAGVLAGHATWQQAVQRSLNEYADRGITRFVDSAGRQWPLHRYAEMSVRTGVHNASREGHQTGLLDYGHDLIMISTHGGTCRLCAPWEGKVLAITGEVSEASRQYMDGYLDDAKSNGLYHPNCRHRGKLFIPGETATPDPAQYGDQTYEHVAEQRRLERLVDKWTARSRVGVTEEARGIARAKIKKYRGELRVHRDAHPLPRVNRNREAYEEALRKAGRLP